MNRETLSQALNLLDDRHISETTVFSPGELRAPSERIVHMNRKRLLSFALAAALILALGAAAYAVSGAGRATATCAMPETGEYTDLAALPEVEQIAGYPVIVPESLSDGYRFSRLAVTGMADYDENGEREREYYTVNAVYSKADASDLMLSLSPVRAESAAPDTLSGEARWIDGIAVSMRQDTYKFVPEDYEKTAAEQAAEEGGHFFISYGAEQISEAEVASADFLIGNVRYTVMDMDADASSLTVLERAAADVIAAAHG
ncbi:MAG: hypothetical protein IKF48_02825 [Oscillospiraceae bacterium]|nr:hypothetical protein [Oscillospiraceae bacterium]